MRWSVMGLVLTAMLVAAPVAAQESPLGTHESAVSQLEDLGFVATSVTPDRWTGQQDGATAEITSHDGAVEAASMHIRVNGLTAPEGLARELGVKSFTFLNHFAPTSLTFIEGLMPRVTDGVDESHDLGDRTVYFRSGVEEPEFFMDIDVVGPNGVTPTAAVPGRIAFFGSRDYNTPRFHLDGGDYSTEQTAAGGDFGCLQFTSLEGLTSVSIGSISTDGSALETQPNNLYGVEPGDYYIAISSTCDWTVSITPQ